MDADTQANENSDLGPAFSTGQLLGLINALAQKRESSLIEVLYLLMIDYMPEHLDEFRQAIWDYLFKSTDEIEEIVNGMVQKPERESEIEDFIALLETEGDIKLPDSETVAEATQRVLNSILLAERNANQSI